MYLQELHGHENIVEIINVLKAENDKDIYIVTDFLESVLHAVIKANILQDIHKQYVIYQLLRALKYMHSGEMIHRDIKPSNILLNSDSCIKLCDFGLARSVAPTAARQTDPVMTDYVATRWYRAPEILFGAPNYTKGVDVWAVGCILAEMIIGKPLFPGTSTLDQLTRVLEVTGRPGDEDIRSIKSTFAVTMLESIRQPSGGRPPPSLATRLPKATPDMIDFMQKCFQFNPLKRATVVELLNHSFVAQFHDPLTEPVCRKPIRIALDDNVRLTVQDYRNRIYDAVMKRKREINHPVSPYPNGGVDYSTSPAAAPVQRTYMQNPPPPSYPTAAQYAYLAPAAVYQRPRAASALPAPVGYKAFNSHRKYIPYHPPPPPKVVEPTATGETSMSGLITYLFRGYN